MYGKLFFYIFFTLFFNSTTGAKEIDIAATLEHLRDQRQDMVKTKVWRGFVSKSW